VKNAHERFGSLEFTKRVKDTTTRIRVHMDRLIAEPAKEDRGTATAHLFSVLGSDAEIANNETLSAWNRGNGSVLGEPVRAGDDLAIREGQKTIVGQGKAGHHESAGCAKLERPLR